MKTAVTRYSRLASIFLLCTTGCATSRDMDAGLNALMGENIDTAISLLGKPTSLQTLDDHTTFGWHASRVDIRSESSPYSVNAHLSPAMYPSIVNASHEYYCDLTLIVDATNHITQWNHDGNRDGCREYGKLLRAYAERAKTQRKN